MPCQGQVRHACVHRRATSRVKAKKKRRKGEGGKRNEKNSRKKGKKKERCWVGTWKGTPTRRRDPGYPGRWAPRYNTRLPLPAAISVNCSVPDKKNVGKIKFSSVIHHEATDAGRAGSFRIG